MSGKDVWLLADFTCKADKVEEIKVHLKQLIPDVRKEKGCLFDDCFQDADDPTKFTFVEHWATMEDAQAHMNGAPAARWGKNAGPLHASGEVIRMLKSIWD